MNGLRGYLPAAVCGLALAPLAWATASQIGLAFPLTSCVSGRAWIAAPIGAAAALALAAAALSYREHGDEISAPRGGWRSFLALVSAATGLVVAFAIVLQGAAALLLSGCEN